MSVLCAISDYHLRSTSSSINVPTSASFSISTWINAVWNPGTTRSLVGIYGPANLNDPPLTTPVTGVQIGTSAGNGDLTFWTWGGGTLISTAAGFMNSFNNVWVNIVYTYDGTTHRGYLNGTEILSSTVGIIPGFLKQVYINGFPGTATSEVHNHQVDSYVFFDRTLTAAEVQTIALSRCSRHSIVLGALVKYEFDELAQGASATLVRDLSDNAINLTNFSVGTPGTPIIYNFVNSPASSNLRPVQ